MDRSEGGTTEEPTTSTDGSGVDRAGADGSGDSGGEADGSGDSGGEADGSGDSGGEADGSGGDGSEAGGADDRGWDVWAEDAPGLDQAGADALECVCGADEVLDLLSARHAIAVVCTVGALQPVRYGRIEDALVDASSSTLSTRLDELLDAGVLSREQYDEIPPRVEYALTDDGAALYEALGPLVAWVRQRDGTGEV